MTKPKVGQILYRLNIGNNARHVPQVLTPVIVSKVGRKYFTVRRYDGPYTAESEHHIDNWYERTEYSADYALYESEQAWADEKEARAICQHIAEAFRYGDNRRNLSIEVLRDMKRIDAVNRGLLIRLFQRLNLP